jgi:protein-tyrosine phosphatase
MKQVHKILMVCLGNICRSPVAEGIMRSKLEETDLTFEIDSAGTSNYHIGENPDARSVKNAIKNGIDISKLKARQFKVTDFDYFDMIYVMDENNKSDVLSLARNEQDVAKVKLILSELPKASYKSVPDPYFGGEAGFQLVFELLDEACESVAQQLLNKTISIKQ